MAFAAQSIAESAREDGSSEGHAGAHVIVIGSWRSAPQRYVVVAPTPMKTKTLSPAENQIARARSAGLRESEEEEGRWIRRQRRR